MATKRRSHSGEFRSSPPELATPIVPLTLEQIIHAVRTARSHSGVEGALDRWGWHPLYQAAVSAIEDDR